jgi:carbon monoxide dehydrogenase subunit G
MSAGGAAVTVAHVSVDVDASPEQVWKVVSDPRNLPRWDHHIVGVAGVPKGGIAEGTAYRTQVRFFGAKAAATSKVVTLDPPRYAKVRVRGLLDATVETWIEPLDGGRTRLRHRVDYRFPGGSIGEVAARAINMLGAARLLRRGAEAQKRQVEAAAD